jgi:hypothetical protein
VIKKQLKMLFEYVNKWMEGRHEKRLKAEFSTDTLKELEKWYGEFY